MTDHAPKPYDDAGLRRAGFKLDRAHRYVDPDGKLVREKLRYERIKNGEREKTFKWVHLNGSGERLFGEGDAPHSLFGRDLLVSCSAEENPEVFICKSEKVCEELHNSGSPPSPWARAGRRWNTSSSYSAGTIASCWWTRTRMVRAMRRRVPRPGWCTP